MEEFSDLVKKSSGPTEDQIRARALDALAALGGKLSKEDDIVFSGEKFVLPEKTDLPQAIRFLKRRMEDEETVTSFQRSFKYRPHDGAFATAKSIRDAFGFSISKPIVTFFGVNPPKLITINVGIDKTESVPWGAITIPGLDNTTLYLGSTNDPELGVIFHVNVEGPRKYRTHIDGLFQLIEKNLNENSIYRGKAIDGAENPNFMDPFVVSEEDVVYTEEVMRQMEANVWSPIRHAVQLEELHQPGKRSVLFEGPYGSGKTLGALLTAQTAVNNGWTFILCRPGKDDLVRTMQTARMYQPSVVFFEDLDVIGKPGEDDGVSQILDTFDGIQTKGLKMLLVLTTNHVEKLHKGMIRPGRLDAVIHIGSMDRPGVEKLARRVIGKSLAEDIDFDAVMNALEGFMPAFVKEAFDRAIRYSVARNDGEVGTIDTEDLVLAANGLRPQLELMNNASDETRNVRMDDIFGRILTGVVNNTAFANRNGGIDYRLAHLEDGAIDEAMTPPAKIKS